MGHRHAGVAAQSDYRGHLFFAQKPPGGQIARQVLDHERDSLAGAAGQRASGQGEIVEPRPAHALPLERLPVAAERDSHQRDHGRKLFRHGQAGK